MMMGISGGGCGATPTIRRPLTIDRSDPNVVRIEVRIQLMGTGTDEQKQAVLQGIADMWNKSSVDGIRLETTVMSAKSGGVKVYVGSKDTWPLLARAETSIVCPGEHRSCVPNAALNSSPTAYIDPTDRNFNGISDTSSVQYLGAHEFGHILGLKDQYGKGGEPKLGYEGNIMAFDGIGVTKQQLEEITTGPVERIGNFI